MEHVFKFYEKYNEEGRLMKDNTHKLEFMTTIKVMNNYISNESKILEVGAGSGIYSFYYSQLANSVSAIDIVPKHVRRINEIIEEQSLSNISCQLGDVRELAMFKDNSFDVVLCLGPMYHLRNYDDQIKCLKECRRVLKNDGILAVAYINYNAAFVRNFVKDKQFLKDFNYNEFVDNVTLFNEARDSFFFTSPIEVEDLMKKNEIRQLNHVGTDGIATIINKNINELSPEEFELWANFHYQTMRDTSILGYSLHGLFIGSK